MTKSTDIQLINDCLKGSQSAYKALYDLYKGYVYTICVRYGISNIEIKDMMQVIFMEVFKSITKFDSEKASFKTWLSRITINQILMQKRKKSIDYTTIEDVKINLIESDQTVPVESQMDKETMHQILNKMPAKYSAVFNLFIIDGFTHVEIAEKLNISVGSSRILLHRGRVWAMKELQFFFKQSEVKIYKDSKI